MDTGIGKPLKRKTVLKICGWLDEPHLDRKGAGDIASPRYFVF